MLESPPKRSLQSWVFEAVLHSQVKCFSLTPCTNLLAASRKQKAAIPICSALFPSGLCIRLTPGSLILRGVGPKFVTGGGHGQAIWCDSEGEHRINIHCQMVHFPHDSIIAEKLVGLIQ